MNNLEWWFDLFVFCKKKMGVPSVCRCTNEYPSFLSYYCEWFDDDSEIFWFQKFKKIVRENFKLMDTDDMDYDAVKEICRSQVKDMYAVALICYDHNETYYREQVMTWVDLAQGKSRCSREMRFLRNRWYYISSRL